MIGQKIRMLRIFEIKYHYDLHTLLKTYAIIPETERWSSGAAERSRGNKRLAACSPLQRRVINHTLGGLNNPGLQYILTLLKCNTTNRKSEKQITKKD